MSNPEIGGPAAGEEPLNPLSLASVILGVLGMLVYCCGSFFCMGWVGFILWLVGAACGGVALSQGTQGTNKIMAIVGVALNAVFLLLMAGLMILGVGMGFLSSLMGYSGY
jgi:hypothetical protein